MSLQQQVLPLTGIGSRDTGQYRGDHLLVAEMVERGSKVLDVGCGDGDLLQLLEARGIDGRGIELSREGVNRCVAKGLAVVQGDADTDLINYPDDAFDIVHASLLLHHLEPEAARALLSEMARVARVGVVLNDLVRGRRFLLGAWLLTRVLRNRFTRSDAPLSVRRAYTVSELTALLATAGLRVERRFDGFAGHRVALAARRNGRS